MHYGTRDSDDVYIEAGESADQSSLFSVDQIAAAFDVDPERVRRAVAGEFDLGPNERVNARMVQHLSEVVLGDFPIDRRDAALMRLGAYTPRSDASDGIGQGPPDEESDRQSAYAGVPDDALASPRSSHDPATQESA